MSSSRPKFGDSAVLALKSEELTLLSAGSAGSFDPAPPATRRAWSRTFQAGSAVNGCSPQSRLALHSESPALLSSPVSYSYQASLCLQVRDLQVHLDVLVYHLLVHPAHFLVNEVLVEDSLIQRVGHDLLLVLQLLCQVLAQVFHEGQLYLQATALVVKRFCSRLSLSQTRLWLH